MRPATADLAASTTLPSQHPPLVSSMPMVVHPRQATRQDIRSLRYRRDAVRRRVRQAPYVVVALACPPWAKRSSRWACCYVVVVLPWLLSTGCGAAARFPAKNTVDVDAAVARGTTVATKPWALGSREVKHRIWRADGDTLKSGERFVSGSVCVASWRRGDLIGE